MLMLVIMAHPDAAAVLCRVEPGTQCVAGESLEGTAHVVEVDSADQGRLLLGEGVERAVPQGEPRILDRRLEPLALHQAVDPLEPLAGPGVRRTRLVATTTGLVAQRL